MLQIIWHHFSVQFSLIFQMVYLVLPSVLHFKTSLLVDPDWLLKVFHQSGAGVSKSNTASKMEHSTWKSNENQTENWCHIVCSILFGLFLCVTSSGSYPVKLKLFHKAIVTSWLYFFLYLLSTMCYIYSLLEQEMMAFCELAITVRRGHLKQYSHTAIKYEPFFFKREEENAFGTYEYVD